MRKVYTTVSDFILKGENSKDKSEVKIDTVQLVKKYKINNKKYIYIKIAVHQDDLEEFLNTYNFFNVEMISPICIIGEKMKRELQTETFKNMEVAYEDTRLENGYVDGLTLILCNEKSEFKEIQFILDDIKHIEKINMLDKRNKNDRDLLRQIEKIRETLTSFDELKEEIIQKINEEKSEESLSS